MKLTTWISLGAIGCFVSVVGCVTDAESLFSNGNNNGSGGAGGNGQGGSEASSSSSSASSSGNSSSSSSGASSSSSASSASSASSSSSSASSSSSGMPNTVFCADAECKPKEICCYHQQDPNLDHCNQDPNCGMGYSVLQCNGPSDCPGAFCCVTRANNVYTGSSCQPTCEGFGNYIACEGDQSVCPMGLNCQQSNSLGIGYMICR